MSYSSNEEEIPCPEIPLGGCSICGTDMCVSDLFATITTTNDSVVECGYLEEEGLDGILECSRDSLPNLDNCKCQKDPRSPTTTELTLNTPSSSSPAQSTPKYSISMMYSMPSVASEQHSFSLPTITTRMPSPPPQQKQQKGQEEEPSPPTPKYSIQPYFGVLSHDNDDNNDDSYSYERENDAYTYPSRPERQPITTHSTPPPPPPAPTIRASSLLGISSRSNGVLGGTTSSPSVGVGDFVDDTMIGVSIMSCVLGFVFITAAVYIMWNSSIVMMKTRFNLLNTNTFMADDAMSTASTVETNNKRNEEKKKENHTTIRFGEEEELFDDEPAV